MAVPGHMAAAVLLLKILIHSNALIIIHGNNLAVFGACYNPHSNALTCNFNASFCDEARECLVPDSEGGCNPAKGGQLGPRLEWKTPTQLAAMTPPVSCSCEKTHVGSCYTVRTDHVATCHLHPDHCPAETIWIVSGYRFGAHSKNPADGTYCKCHDNRGVTETQFGVCKKSITSRCSVDAGHCEAGEEWMDPQDALQKYGIACPSYNVEVGACKAQDGTTTCVVDADSCNIGDTWLPVSQANAEGLDCKLDAVGLEPTPPAPDSQVPEKPKPTHEVVMVVNLIMSKSDFSTLKKDLYMGIIADVAAVSKDDVTIQKVRSVKTKRTTESIDVWTSIQAMDLESAGEIAESLSDNTVISGELAGKFLVGTIKQMPTVGELHKKGGLGAGSILLIITFIIAITVGGGYGLVYWMKKRKERAEDNIFLPTSASIDTAPPYGIFKDISGAGGDTSPSDGDGKGL